MNEVLRVMWLEDGLNPLAISSLSTSITLSRRYLGPPESSQTLYSLPIEISSGCRAMSRYCCLIGIFLTTERNGRIEGE